MLTKASLIRMHLHKSGTTHEAQALPPGVGRGHSTSSEQRGLSHTEHQTKASNNGAHKLFRQAEASSGYRERHRNQLKEEVKQLEAERERLKAERFFPGVSF